MPLTVKAIWRTQKDGQVCPICKALDGYTWSIEAGEPYPKKLVHPIYGPVYDARPAAECSLVKEEKGHQCRCTLEHHLDVSCASNNDDVEPQNCSKQPEKKQLENHPNP